MFACSSPTSDHTSCGSRLPGDGEHDRAAAVEDRERAPLRADVHQRRQEQHHRADRQHTLDDLVGMRDRSLAASSGRRRPSPRRRCPRGATPHPWACPSCRPCTRCTGRRPSVRRSRARPTQPRAPPRSRSEPSITSPPLSSSTTSSGPGTGVCAERSPDPGCERPVIHQRDEIGVVVEVRELRLHVPVVHVHGHRAELVRGEHGLEVLDAVVELQPDVVPRTDAALRERVREPVRPRVELRVGAPDRRRHDRLALGHGIGDALEQLGQVVAHEPMVDGPQIRVKSRRTHRAGRCLTNTANDDDDAQPPPIPSAAEPITATSSWPRTRRQGSSREPRASVPYPGVSSFPGNVHTPEPRPLVLPRSSLVHSCLVGSGEAPQMAGQGRLVTRRFCARSDRSSSVSRPTSGPRSAGSSGSRREDRSSWSGTIRAARHHQTFRSS